MQPALWSWRGPVQPRPPGWFPDPTAHHPYRYWSGETWTDYVSTPDTWPRFSNDRYPIRLEQGIVPSDSAKGENLRKGSLGLTFAGIFGAFGLSALVALVWILVGHPGGELVLLSVSEIGLWTGLFYTCWLMSKRYGSGHLRRDFNLSFRWFDFGIGLVGALIGRFFTDLIASAFTGPNLGQSNQLLGVTADGAVTWTVLVLIICVCAPIFEELFFRGLLQGGLVNRFGTWIGIPLTAIIFGSAHVFNAPGFAGVVYALSIMGGGMVLGTVYALTHRLGASVATHSFFNALALTAFANWPLH